MKRFTGLAMIAALLFGAPAFAQTTDRPKDDPVVYYSGDDREMNAAFAEAARTRNDFWRLFDTDRDVAGTAAVKLAFPIKGGDGNEYMWVDGLYLENGQMKGRLNNIPARDVGLKEGDIVVVRREQIIDWLYFRGGRMYGAFTIRAMLKDLPPENARQMRELLSDRPIEGDVT